MDLETRNLWSQCPTIKILDGLLVREKENHPIQLVVRNVCESSYFQWPTLDLSPLDDEHLALAYYWPGMRKEISSWCQQCLECATIKEPPTKHKGPLQKVFTGAPLDIVAVDVLSGVPVTPDGLKYILVLTDYFTKWPCAFAKFWKALEHIHNVYTQGLSKISQHASLLLLRYFDAFTCANGHIPNEGLSLLALIKMLYEQ